MKVVNHKNYLGIKIEPTYGMKSVVSKQQKQK